MNREPYRSSPEHYSVYRSSLVKSCQKMSFRGWREMERLMEEIWRRGEDRQAKGKSKRGAGRMDGSVQVDRSVGARSVYAILWRPLKAVVEVRFRFGYRCRLRAVLRDFVYFDFTNVWMHVWQAVDNWSFKVNGSFLETVRIFQYWKKFVLPLYWRKVFVKEWEEDISGFEMYLIESLL